MVNRALVGAGIAVSELRPERASLEEVFLEPQVPTPLVEAWLRLCQSRGLDVHLGGLGGDHAWWLVVAGQRLVTPSLATKLITEFANMERVAAARPADAPKLTVRELEADVGGGLVSSDGRGDRPVGSRTPAPGPPRRAASGAARPRPTVEAM